MAAKSYTLKDIPRTKIDFIVGRLHVGTPDEEIVKDMEERAKEWPAGARKLAIKYALDRHHKNQGVYNDVMGGRIGRGRAGGDPKPKRVRFWYPDGQGGGEWMRVTPEEAERLYQDPDYLNNAAMNAGETGEPGEQGYARGTASEKRIALNAQEKADFAALEKAVELHARRPYLKKGVKVGSITITNVGTHTVEYKTKGGWKGSLGIRFVGARGEPTEGWRSAMKEAGYEGEAEEYFKKHGQAMGSFGRYSAVRNKKLAAALEKVLASFGTPDGKFLDRNQYKLDTVAGPLTAHIDVSGGQNVVWFFSRFADPSKLAKAHLHSPPNTFSGKWNQYFGNNDIPRAVELLRKMLTSATAHRSGQAGGWLGSRDGTTSGWIRPGDRVKFIDARGTMRSGRVVMRSSHPGSWVINVGGKSGTPMVVAESDLFGNTTRKDPMTGRAGGKSGEVVKVLFRKDKEGVVFAIFPEMKEHKVGWVGIFDAVGGHHAGPLSDNIHSSKPATPAEYKKIKSQLEGGYGYKLQVMQRASYKPGRAGSASPSKPRGKAGHCGCEKE